MKNKRLKPRKSEEKRRWSRVRMVAEINEKIKLKAND